MATKLFKSGPRLVKMHGKLPVIYTPTTIPPSLTIQAPSGSFTTGIAILIAGTVYPSGDTVQVALSDQNANPPSTGLVAVVPNGGRWSQSLVPTTAGTKYAWAIDQDTGLTAVSGPLVVQDPVVVGSINVTAPSNVVIHPGDAITATGVVSPAGQVQYQPSTQNVSAPTGGWLSATSNASGNWSGAFTAGAVGTWYVWAKEPVSGVTAVSSSFSVTAATQSSVAIPFGVANAADATATDPYHLCGAAFAPGDVPAGYYPKVTLADGVTELKDYQWCAQHTRDRGDLQFAVLRMKAEGSFSAYGQAGFTKSYKIIPTPGSGPSGTAISLADIMTRSQFQLRFYGIDLTPELNDTSDYFYVDVNEVLTGFPRDTAGWGVNPVGGYRINWQGKVSTCITAWRILKRKSDGANHKWLRADIYVHALSGGEFEVCAWLLESNLYGPHASGTVGPGPLEQPNVPSTYPAQPRYAGNVEIWEAKTNTFVGGWGGSRDPRGTLTLPASAFGADNRLNLTSFQTAWPSPTAYPVQQPTYGGPLPTGTGVMFAPADGSSTLPSGLDPNRVYWIANASATGAVVCMERWHVASIRNGGGFPPQQSWAPNEKIFQLGAVRSVSYVYLYPMNNTGTTAATPPNVTVKVIPANTFITDGSVQWSQATAYFGTGGTGNIKIIPVASTFNNCGVAVRDKFGERFWFDPAGKPRPRTLPMPDFTYATEKSRCIPRFEYYTPNPVPPSRTFLYSPNTQFPMTGRQPLGAWEVARQPGESEDDYRLGQWNGWACLQLYQPTDRPTAQNARTWTSNFGLWAHWARDERTGYPVLCNKGPNRLGGDYPLFPPGTVNSSLYWHKFYRLGIGSPKPMGLIIEGSSQNYRHQSGFQYNVYNQAANGTHMPNPGASQYILDGDPMWLDFAMQWYSALLTSYLPNMRNRTYKGVPYCGLISLEDMQPRGTGWDMTKAVNANIITPNDHPMRPYIDDNMNDQSGYLSNYAAIADAITPVPRRWGCAMMPPLFVNGNVGNPFSYGHQFQGMSFAADSYERADGTSSHPGFLKFINDFMPGMYRLWDPTIGGCVYNMGTDQIFTSSGSDYAATEFPTMEACYSSAVMNPANTTYSVGQIVGSFVCPGPGQAAPARLPNLSAEQWPGIGFGNANALAVSFRGYAPADAQSLVMLMMAPAAITTWLTGVNPTMGRVWDAARVRQFQAPAIGITLVRPGVESAANRVTDGFFMYAFKRKPVS